MKIEPSKHRIAIVDNEELYSIALATIIRNNPNLTICGIYPTSVELIKMMTKTKPHIILMDVRMPHKDGINATKEILNKYPDVKIVGVSFSAEGIDIKNMFEVGAIAYITKDSTKKEFEELFATIINGQRFVGSKAAVNYTLYANEGKNKVAEASTSLSLNITERELEIMHHIANGLSNKEIASTLNLSKRTIDAHKQKLMTKMGTRKATEIVSLGYKLNLIKK